MAKRLHRASPKTGRRMSLRKIGAALAEAGHLNERVGYFALTSAFGPSRTSRDVRFEFRKAFRSDITNRC